MKYKANDPLAAALKAGGCTLEPESGWWTYSADHLQGIGKKIKGVRDALYIPTLQKNGMPVATEHIESLKAHAKSLGFENETAASGMWVLSETGEVQIEYIWILWTEKIGAKIRKNLGNLAEKIKNLTNQDSVAYELGGKLNFV
jgi:hypothetical protein